MSIWTSEPIRRAALVVACLTLAACGGGFRGLGGGGSSTAPAPQQVAVTSDQIVVAGPAGYCVDPTATRDQGDTGFVLLGNCAAIANSRRADQPELPALLTAAISAPSEDGRLSDSLGDLDGFFRSEEGLALLSRTGEAASVTILNTAIEGDVFFLHANDESEAAIDGVQNTYWRAYMDIGRRIATLSVLALEDRQLTNDQSLATLRSFTQSMRAANAFGGPQSPATAEPFESRPSEPVAPRPSGPQSLPLDDPRFWNVGLFRRIFS